MTNWRYATPALEIGDPIICHTVALRPALWGVLFNELQRLSSETSWRQDDPTHATPGEVALEFEKATDITVFSGCVMIGQIIEVALDTIPAWILPCDGSTYARDDYPDLYDALHTNYHDGPDFFHVPDRVGRFALGGIPVGSQGGEENHTLTELEMPGHTHIYNEHVPGLALAPGELPVATPVAAPIPTTSAGLGLAHNNMPPYEGSQFCIIAKLPGA